MEGNEPKKIIKVKRDGNMDIKDIVTLVNAVSNSHLKSFMYQEGNIKLYFEAERSTGAHREKAEEAIVEDIGGGEQVKGNAITSPMVGTFYSAPSEGAVPYVNEGDIVKVGQVIGIVEAMKLMNEIESPYDGVVKRILVKNKDMVGFGQELMMIES